VNDWDGLSRGNLVAGIPVFLSRGAIEVFFNKLLSPRKSIAPAHGRAYRRSGLTPIDPDTLVTLRHARSPLRISLQAHSSNVRKDQEQSKTKLIVWPEKWWGMLRNAVQKAQDRKEIDSSIDARRVSFDLNGILMAAHWAFLVEKDPRIFGECRIAVRAKLESLPTRIPASAFKSENAWKEYLEGKRKNKSVFDGLRRLTQK
jgi:hypothetical protein